MELPLQDDSDNKLFWALSEQCTEALATKCAQYGTKT